MKIRFATVTGADDKTSIDSMVRIRNRYPFVEWGILFSPKRIGESRYPSSEWLEKLKDKGSSMRISAHICGVYSQELLTTGICDALSTNTAIDKVGAFYRVQLNFNSSKHTVSEKFYRNLRISAIHGTVILQYNDSNCELNSEVISKGIGVSFLYDSSGGLGVLEKQWKPPVGNFFTGYAGGLTPDNLEEELKKIEAVVGDNEIWIDAETGLRTNDTLDLDKVLTYLQIASKYV